MLQQIAVLLRRIVARMQYNEIRGTCFELVPDSTLFHPGYVLRFARNDEIICASLNIEIFKSYRD